MEMWNELSVQFEKRVEKGRIECPKAIKLINLYLDEIQNTDQDKIDERLTSLMVLRYLIVSGDDMCLDRDPTEFHKEYRSWGVIPNSGLCCHDMIMWNLMHSDALIWKALDKFFEWKNNGGENE
ncbi:hypothetical protein PHYNN_224 [Pantoea phage Phynn]|nr:hypothetical protein PHYNN_224 [Pantoea phage Phynn]